MKHLLLPILFLATTTFSWSKTNLVIADPLPSVQITGSALCETLTLTYNLPDSLKSEYTIKVDVVINETSNTAEVLYRATKTGIEHYIEKVETNISDYFLPIDMNDFINSWNFNISFQIGNNIQTIGSRVRSPYATCVDFVYDCDSIIVTERTLNRAIIVNDPIITLETNSTTEIGPKCSHTSLSYSFSNDTLHITQTSYMSGCLSNDIGINTKSLTILDFDREKYTVQLLKKIDLRTTFHERPTTDTEEKIINPIVIISESDYYLNSEPAILGFADMRNCVISALDKKHLAQYAIYPNPASQSISIDNFNGEVKLINQLGQTFILNNAYSVEHLSAGRYIATYEIEGELVQSHLIIE